MKKIDLQFFSEVEGKKNHLVFRQARTFFVVTTMDEDSRGNFFAVTDEDIDLVKSRIELLDLDTFHPREIDLFRSMADEDFRQSRLRNICYVLVALRELMVERVGRELHFRTWGVSRIRVSMPPGKRKVATAKIKSKSRPRLNPIHSQEYDYYLQKVRRIESEKESSRPKSVTSSPNISIKNARLKRK